MCKESDEHLDGKKEIGKNQLTKKNPRQDPIKKSSIIKNTPHILCTPTESKSWGTVKTPRSFRTLNILNEFY